MVTLEAGPKRRATIKDVARIAKVSPATVSNAISGKRKVDSGTRRRIDAAIEELGYVPNLAARRMRTGQANTIAIFSSMPTAVAAGPSKLGFLMELAASAAATALERNVALVLVPPMPQPEAALATIPFDGAILVEPARDDPYVAMLRARGVPTVVIGPPKGLEGPCVRFDHASIAEVLIDHLLEVGARDFPLVIGASTRASNLVFRKVYEARMRDLRLPFRVLEVPEAEAESGARTAILAEIDAGRPMDGVLVPIDAMATGVMAALRDRAVGVPAEVRVATRYDGIRARSEDPPLTALNLHLDDVSRRATEILIALVEKEACVSERDAPPAALIIRESSKMAE